MAEKLQLKVEEVKGAIHVFDRTGKYQKKCNEGGWGHPNLKVSDISKAEITVFPPESSEPIVIDVYPSLPNEKGIGFEILAEELGLKEIVSGVWKFEYKVTHAPDQEGEIVICVYNYELLCGVISCCIDDRKSSLACDPSSEDSKKTTLMSSLLSSAKFLMCKGDMDEAQKIIKHLTLQCKCCL